MLIVDGHNLTFADPEARGQLEGDRPGGARQRTLELVETYLAATREQAVVVFDGTGGGRAPEPTHRRLRCRSSGAGRSADAEILDMIRKTTGRRELCVVTNDRRLGAAARSLHARTMGSQEFLAAVARIKRRQQRKRPTPEPRGKRSGAPPSEVRQWLDVFREEDVAAIEKEHGLGDGKRGKRTRR